MSLRPDVPSRPSNLVAAVLRRPAVLTVALTVLLGIVPALSGPALAQQANPQLWSADGSVFAVEAAGDTLYIGGSFAYVGPNSGGAVLLDATSGTPVLGWPSVTGTVECAASDGAGGWYIGGQFTAVGGVSRNNLAHVLSDFTVAAWNPSADQGVRAMAVNGSTVYVGGYFNNVGGQNRNHIAALDATTGLATAWNPNADLSVIVVRVSGGMIYAGGEFLNIGGQARARVAALDPSTGLASSWNPGGSGQFSNVVIDLQVVGNTVYIAGVFTVMGGTGRNNIAAVDAATAVATSWNPNASSDVWKVVVQGGSVYVGGNFASIGGQSRGYVAKLDATTGLATGWNAFVNSTVTALTLSGSTLYLGGNFTFISTQPWNSLVAVDTTTGGRIGSWTAAANGMARDIVMDGTLAMVVGNFSSGGGKMRSRLAALDLNTGQATEWNPGASLTVRALTVSGSTLYVGGQFSTIGGQTRNLIAAIDSSGAVTPWNPNANGTVLTLAVNGSTVYAGGAFTTIGGASRNRIAALDAGTGLATPWNPNSGSTVSAIAVGGPTIYLGGQFSTMGGQPRNRIAAVDASTGAVTAWDPNSSGSVTALAVDGAIVYAGGFFTSIGGQPRNRIVAIDAYTGLLSSWNPSSNGIVRTLRVRGRRVYVGGNFTTGFGSPSIGGADRENVAALDVETGLATGWNPNANGEVFSLALSPTTAFAGGDFGTVGGIASARVAAISIPTHTLNVVSASGSVTRDPDQPTYADGAVVTLTARPDPGAGFVGWGGDASGSSNPLVVSVDANMTVTAAFASTLSILEIEPNQAGDDGPASVVSSGVGFQSGATAKLVRSGQPDIVGTGVEVAPDGRSLTAVFDLAGRAQGVWDLVETNLDLSTATLPGAFTIGSGASRQLRVDVIGPALIRPNRRVAFDVVLENLGNSDVLDVPLWITRLPASATVELDFALASPPRAGGEPDWSTAPLTLDGPGGKYLALVIPRLPPGTSVRRIYLTVPNTVTGFELDAALTPVWADGAVFRDCLGSGGVITAPACMGSQLTAINAALDGTPGIDALSGIGLWAKIAWQCEGAVDLPAALVKAEAVLDFMLQRVEGGAVPAGCEVALTPRWQDPLTVGVVTSVDPNDKLGAGGVGANRLIGSEQILPYSIRFENLQTATAPAQEVVVLDAIDAVTLDLNTVSLGRITFGNRSIEPPPGLSSYTTDVDLRPQQQLIVRVGVSLDRATGLMGWSLRSIDPATGQPPVNPLAGFLPPNITPPQGEGSLLFTVMPKIGLSGGTPIRNRATINFDGDPRQTPEWSNTLDTTPPESQVLPLGATQDSASFTVRWQAVGSPTDLHDFSVYVSQNGGAFRPWRLHTTATADTIGAPGGGNYSFYSLARDSSGNLEPVPASPDVQTFSRVAVEEQAPARLALEGAVPNPTIGEARVWFTLPSREGATLEVMDVAGRRLMRREVGVLGPGRHSVDLTTAAQQPGLYFLRLVQGGRTLRSRMAVIR